MKEFLMRQTDKFILFALIIFFTFVALHIVHDVKDAATVNWSLTMVSGVVGSLLTLITGAISKANANPNNEKKEEL